VKHILSFSLGALAGASLLFAILNGGACRPEPTPTDEGTPVSAPVVPKPAADVPIAAPVVEPKPEVKPEPAAVVEPVSKPITIEVK